MSTKEDLLSQVLAEIHSLEEVTTARIVGRTDAPAKPGGVTSTEGINNCQTQLRSQMAELNMAELKSLQEVAAAKLYCRHRWLSYP
jgi:hypothetical protein